MPSLYAAPTTNEDVVTNCDMLQDPQGVIKAATWSAMKGGPTFPGSNICQFMVEDYNGNMVIQDINTSPVSGAMQPDIVLANSPDDNGHPGYQVLVVYIVPDIAFRYAEGTAYLDVYDITNIGTPSIGLSLRSTCILSTTCNGYPHIDMWSDANTLTNGLPTMTDFATVWAEGTTGNLYGMFGTVNSPCGMPTNLPTISGHSNIYMPDVACVTSNDPVRGATSRQIELAYGNGVNNDTIRTITATNVIHEEMQESGGSWSTTVGPTTLATYQPFAPRIEAMSQYSTNTHDAKWQIAVTNLGGSSVNGYNNLTSASLSAFAYVPPVLNNNFQAAYVAAGIGRFLNTTNIGNRQYTAGYYPWGTPYNYSRDISAATGNIITPSPYVINTTSQPVEYWWDVNQSLSLSNCSNSGKDLLAVWADTFGIVYKYSPSNAGTTWRVIKPKSST
ncbi:MAG: hypothetical protein ABI169_15560, partial [Chitinophagaceae bacterium]